MDHKSCVQGCKLIKKLNKRCGDFKVRFYPAKFPTCEREFNKSLEMGIVVHAFNPSTWKAEYGGSLSLRSTWSTEQVTGQQRIGNDSIHWKQKVGEHITQQER